MVLNKKTLVPSGIQYAIDNDYQHVFMISNPVVAMIVRIIIDTYGIQSDKIVCISMRNTDTSIIEKKPINPPPRWYDTIYTKIFGKTPFGKRIANVVRKNNDRFLLYTSWNYPDVEGLLCLPLCAGHIYLEEGWLSYGLYKPYAANQLNIWKSRLRYRNSRRNDFKDYFRDDALAFIGILPDVFPLVPNCKRKVLNDYSDALLKYKPKLTGIKTIGLTPAPRRVAHNQWESMLKALVDRMPDGGVIKLHPGFSADIMAKNELELMLTRISRGLVVLCSDSIILEMEMLSESKKLIGPRTSLVRYAKAFGSEFIQIELY